MPDDSDARRTVPEVLGELRPVLERLFKGSGNVGASIGVLTNSEQHFLGIGSRGLDAAVPPTEDTLYLISSMTKPLLGLAVAALVEDDNKYGLDFDTPVREFLPHLHGKTLLRHEPREATIGDFLDHRTEFLRTTNLWESPDGAIPWKTTEPILALLRHLPLSDKFKPPDSFALDRNYSNEAFALLTLAIEKATNTPWGRFVEESVLRPLGMKDTLIGIREGHSRENFADSHSVDVEGILKGLVKQTEIPSVDSILEVLGDLNCTPRPVKVLPSQISSSPLGAAAGAQSTVSDWLKFSLKYLKVHTLVKKKQDPRTLPKIDRAMFAQIKYILTKTADGANTNAAGWSFARIPWDPRRLCRWPGADGDNPRQLQRAFGNDRLSANRAWHFFQAPYPGSSDKQTDALYHGGSMNGATSFCFLHPATKTAVVVLCNTRGFYLDMANLSCMLLADLLLSPGDAGDRCSKVTWMAQRISAQYLHDATRYERVLMNEYRELMVKEKYMGCIGVYQLIDRISMNVEETGSGVRLRMYNQEFLYPLRVKQASSDGSQVTATFAMSMCELSTTGVGGKNRLSVKDFEIIFRGRDSVGQFSELVWVFDRAGAPKNGAVDAFVWKRIS